MIHLGLNKKCSQVHRPLFDNFFFKNFLYFLAFIQPLVTYFYRVLRPSAGSRLRLAAARLRSTPARAYVDFGEKYVKKSAG